MNRYYKARFQLKNQAKDRLIGKYPDTILLLIISGAIQVFAYMLATFIVPFQNLFGILFSLILTFLVSIVLSVLRVGTSLFYLNIACGQPFSISNLFYGFREQSNKCLAVCTVMCGLSFLFELPAQICSILSATQGIGRYLLYSYGLDFLAQIVFLPLSLALSQCYYLILDYPELSAAETIKMSLRVMKGHKLRLLILQLSFLPLIILAYLSFTVGFLWLTPYMQMTYTLFFLDLMTPKEAAG